MAKSVSRVVLTLLVISLVVGCTLAQRGNGGGPRKKEEVKPVRKETKKQANDDETDSCPEPNGHFADAEQCDKYYSCNENNIEEKLCPDGMVFNDYSPDQEKCDLPNNIDCSQRPKLQTPRPTKNCPRLNGYFAHEDVTNCDTFFYCVDGQFNMITCPAGLVFNQKTGICTWPDEAHKANCGSKDLFQFTCPTVDEQQAATHPRYADPDDCQFFYVCINGLVPRRNGCKLGQVFDAATKFCKWPREVAECIDWYDGRLTAKELMDLENPPVKIKPSKPTTVPQRKRPSRTTKKPVEDEDDE